MTDLFDAVAVETGRPLADRMRPRTLDEFAGQGHLLAPGKPLRRAIEEDRLHSMLFWGPPGTGKTTLARMIAHYCGAQFLTLSAVLSGVKDIRAAVDRAREHRQMRGQPTVLFVDEVHRFNKAQQDAFLPHVEDGTIAFVGATTENPSFELNNALLSRVRTYVLKALTEADIRAIIDAALSDTERGLGGRHLHMADELRDRLAKAADGDARRALNLLEIAADLAEEGDEGAQITEATLDEVTSQGLRRFDKGGEMFYDQISALHKAVRGSDPDASLYWLCRMIDGGCDLVYLSRRIVRMASEDIGNADPRGLTLALQAWDVYERLGSPEGELALAQAVVYLACAPKSNAVYTAYGRAMADVRELGSLEVPLHLRNAPTKLMKELDYGKDYRYAHDEPDGFAAGERYFPDDMPERHYYQPVDRGLETRIREKLEDFRRRNRQARMK
ncbi:recombination factor protein RarA [Thioalkalivibrio denitrificans]|uniref:Replication-associated recombination protein A n=1 Tax=Thioalkalivibrio denitrificans TaxID=108003 RepID=A0A1V3NM56_9GAMM|nr:replication-associated recombination protein A [Thioalkalivibrio denitrificans]OOG25932.1 recombination factor protein RarA [Thioalkalivibrio denitrificans]